MVFPKSGIVKLWISKSKGTGRPSEDTGFHSQSVHTSNHACTSLGKDSYRTGRGWV